jgi:hypothetical protein
MGQDAQHQPAGPPASGETATTPAVQRAVAEIRQRNAEQRQDRRDTRRTR